MGDGSLQLQDMISISLSGRMLIGSILLLSAPPLPALIFFDTGDPAHNREVAPGGAWAGSGWHYQGDYKNFLGTMISPRHFVTARHLGVGETEFIHKTYFSGVASDRTYYLNPTVNGGAGFWNITGTDLRLFEVYGDFPAYAPLYTKSNEAGKETVMMGRGVTRGEAVTLSGDTRGWKWGVSDKRARWGVNDIDSIVNDPSFGELLVTDFDEAPGTEECQAGSGDSGGALFIKDLGTWKLAGIFYGVDGSYDTNSICGDGTDHNGAMFEALGFFIGDDTAECDGWDAVTIGDDTDESRSFSTRISASAIMIQAIIQDALDDESKTPFERYNDWIAEFGLGSESLPGEDADHDRWPNVVEYLAGLDPGVVDEPARPFRVDELPGKIQFTMRIRLDAVARGLIWQIQGTDDLVAQSYTAVSGMTLTSQTQSLAEGVEILEYEISQPGSSKMFYRLEVTLAP